MTKPSIHAAEDDERPVKPTVVEYEDIDPADWLSEDDVVIENHYYNLPDGKRIRIAPLTDAEEFQVQKASRRPDPSNPQRKIREFTVYKREFIAASINKASGATIGSRSYVEGRQLSRRLVGELTNIMTEIMKISGMDVGGTASSEATSFFD